MEIDVKKISASGITYVHLFCDISNVSARIAIPSGVTFKINLGGVFLVNKILLPLLEKGSKIVITTSELAPLDPLPFTGIYAVTKAALEKYAFSLPLIAKRTNIEISLTSL